MLLKEARLSFGVTMAVVLESQEWLVVLKEVRLCLGEPISPT